MHSNYPFSKICEILIIVVIIITATGLFYPVTSATFSPWYGSIAKNIALTNNWSDLILSNQDWLDKPHFPFWITAFFFKIFGIKSFAYVLPGLLFHLLGAIYTYKVADFLYKSRAIALLATLIYVTTLHLMLSAIDVRAEAYLLGQIMPAVYFWLNYDKKFSIKYLLLGAFFTGLALMTKGVFVIITIVSGLLCLWGYQKRLINIIHPKWLGALLISFLFALPEVWALYQQFDLHPEKVIFGQNHISGIRWFFIDSQFGRFFGTGPIVTTNPLPLHQLFFIHTFLWAFLPWSLVYPVAIYYAINHFREASLQDRNNSVLLLGYFFISFIMFSITSFQVDHYTNIIFPFAAILCAKTLINLINSEHKIFLIQNYLSILILAIIAILAGLMFKGFILSIFVIIEISLAVILIKHWGQPPLIKTIILASSAISLLFIFAMLVNGILYHKYDSGYNAAQITNVNPKIPVVDYMFDSRALEFFSLNKYYKLEKQKQLRKFNKFYLVTPEREWKKLSRNYPHAELIAEVKGNSAEQVIPYLGNQQALEKHLKTYDVILIEN